MLRLEKQPELSLYWWPSMQETNPISKPAAPPWMICSVGTLEDLKGYLGVLLKTALENESGHRYTEVRISNLIFLYEHTCDMAAGAYFIASENSYGKSAIQNV